MIRTVAPIRSRETKNNSASAVSCKPGCASIGPKLRSTPHDCKYKRVGKLNWQGKWLTLLFCCSECSLASSWAKRMTGFTGSKKRAQTAPSPLRKDPVG